MERRREKGGGGGGGGEIGKDRKEGREEGRIGGEREKEGGSRGGEDRANRHKSRGCVLCKTLPKSEAPGSILGGCRFFTVL